jgi:hypothetical protein
MLENKPIRTPVYLTDEQLKLWIWVEKNFTILDRASKIKLGSTTLYADLMGNLKAKYEVWSMTNADITIDMRS